MSLIDLAELASVTRAHVWTETPMVELIVDAAAKPGFVRVTIRDVQLKKDIVTVDVAGFRCDLAAGPFLRVLAERHRQMAALRLEPPATPVPPPLSRPAPRNVLINEATQIPRPMPEPPPRPSLDDW